MLDAPALFLIGVRPHSLVVLQGCSSMLKIRPACKEDFARIDELFDEARAYMISYGNPTQWTNGFPNSSTLEEPLAKGEAFVCYDDEHNDLVVGVFVLSHEESVYHQLDGKWSADRPYVVIHRLATASGFGAGQFIFNEVMKNHDYIRVDTHKANKPMLHIMEKLGFKHIGDVIYERPGGDGVRICFDYLKA